MRESNKYFKLIREGGGFIRGRLQQFGVYLELVGFRTRGCLPITGRTQARKSAQMNDLLLQAEGKAAAMYTLILWFHTLGKRVSALWLITS